MSSAALLDPGLGVQYLATMSHAQPVKVAQRPVAFIADAVGDVRRDRHGVPGLAILDLATPSPARP